MQPWALCSAQTTVSPLKMLIVTLEGIVCSGEFRIHNSKVVGASPTPATISSIDSKTYVVNSLLPGLVDLNNESFIYSAHVGRKLVSESAGQYPHALLSKGLGIRHTYVKTGHGVWVEKSKL